MDKKPITTNAAPAAIGPYSQAIVSGHFVFTAGQIPLDPESGDLIGGDVRLQAKQALDNVEAVLAAAGSNLQKAVKVTIYVTDITDFATVNEVYASRVGVLAPPARTTVAVSDLPRGAKVEIDVIATL